MKLNGHQLFWVVLVFCVVMVNPPVVFWVNAYCETHPITFGWPTMYLWLEFWFIAMILDFLIAAWKLKVWDCRQDEQEILPVERAD